MALNPRAFGPPSLPPTGQPARQRPTGLARLTSSRGSAGSRPPELGGDLKAVQSMRRLPTFPSGGDTTASPETDGDTFSGLDFSKAGPAMNAAPRGLERLTARPAAQGRPGRFAFSDPTAPGLGVGGGGEAGEAGVVDWGGLSASEVQGIRSFIPWFDPAAKTPLSSVGETGSPPTSGVALTDTAEGLATAQGLAGALGGRGGFLGTQAANFGLNAFGLPTGIPNAGLLGLFGIPTSLLGLARAGLIGSVQGVVDANLNEGLHGSTTGVAANPGGLTANEAANPGLAAALGLAPSPAAPGGFSTNFSSNPPAAPQGLMDSLTGPANNPAPPADFDLEGAAFGLGNGPSGEDGTSSAPGSDTGGVGGVWHKGGRVPNRGSKRREDVKGQTLKEGEFVVDDDSTDKYGPLLDRINREEPRGLERLTRGRHGRR